LTQLAVAQAAFKEVAAVTSAITTKLKSGPPNEPLINIYTDQQCNGHVLQCAWFRIVTAFFESANNDFDFKKGN
jgi:hypothetical protein